MDGSDARNGTTSRSSMLTHNCRRDRRQVPLGTKRNTWPAVPDVARYCKRELDANAQDTFAIRVVCREGGKRSLLFAAPCWQVMANDSCFRGRAIHVPARIRWRLGAGIACSRSEPALDEERRRLRSESVRKKLRIWVRKYHTLQRFKIGVSETDGVSNEIRCCDCP